MYHWSGLAQADFSVHFGVAVSFAATPAQSDSILMTPLRVAYEMDDGSAAGRDPHVLAVLSFQQPCALADPRYLCVPLANLGRDCVEVWRTQGVVHHGQEQQLRWSSDGEYLFFAIEVDEASHGGADPAAEFAYRQLSGFLEQRRAQADAPGHVLRLWNYLDAINDGAGDEERYRQFCAGRARGMDEYMRADYPAATAIGCRDGRRVLQVYGLAGQHAARMIENPRQVSAWRYPREYGPVAPTFARAAHTAADQLLLSGTAAVVGHASLHDEDSAAQLQETLVNLDILRDTAAFGDARGVSSLLKAYLRDPGDAEQVARGVRAHYPALQGLLLLHGDICRRELRVEIDGIHGNAATQTG